MIGSKRHYGSMSDKRGFSAIEVTMVATVVAILALIALPAYLDRLEDARLDATLDEMKQISTAQIMARAYTGHYFRLHDLDNTDRFIDSNGDLVPDANVEGNNHYHDFVPSAFWNEKFPAGPAQERRPLARELSPRRWTGPYLTIQNFRTISIDEIANDPDLQAMFDTAGGPLPYHGPQAVDALDRYPIDSWGTPYLFFGVGQPIGYSGSESSFLARVYSLGPDGLPGDGQAYTAANLYPPEFGGVLGAGDDLVFNVGD